MTTNVLDVEIARLERQLADLKAQREQSQKTISSEAPATRSEFYGIFEGQIDCSYEDIVAAKYRPKFDWLDDEDGQPAK